MEGKPLHAAVLGAAGTIGPAIIRDLAASVDEIASLLALDMDAERAGQVAQEQGGDRARAAAVDARDPERLAAALHGVDVLVNAASYRINLDVMEACLQSRCHYLDLGGLYWMTQRQLELAERFRQAGVLAILGIGSSPGKTNLMALRGVQELGGSGIASVDVAAASRDPAAVDDGRLHPPYAIRTLVDELALDPVVLQGGQPVAVAPLSAGGVVDFGDPIGTAETIFTLHSEMATFAESFGCQEGSFRLSLPEPTRRRLEELVGASEEEVQRAAREAAPQSNQTVSVHVVMVQGTDGRRCAVRALTRPHFGLGGSIVSTAAPAAAAVRLLARGSVGATGVLPPERCLDPGEMFAELEGRGCRFSLTD